MPKTRATATGQAVYRAVAQLDPAWAQRAPAWRKLLSPIVRFDAAALALIQPEAPRPDMFLLCDGAARGALNGWCGGPFRDDPLLKQAVAHECHHQPVGHAGLLPGHAVAVAQPACPQRRVWWWLVLAREAEPFTEIEQKLTAILLRTLAARFEFPDERHLGRILLDASHELLYVDAATCARLLYTPQLIGELKDLLPRVIAQRWDPLDDHETHSLFLTLDDRPMWVRFSRGRAAGDDSRNWYIELRPLDPDDPPPVALVDDPRVAIALGHLADHFHQSPSLAQIAARVNTSPFHFHRLFTRQTSVSPKHFLLRTQLVHAKQLLRATRRPIGDVAKATGFSSHGHFTATFNRFVGRNPSDYREQA